MVRLDDAVPARLKTHGTTFEVLVDPDGALALKRGDSVNLEDILAVEDVFENASRGDRSPEEDLQKAFRTTDPLSIAPIIIKKGEISLTADQRKRFLENKRRQVIEVIAKIDDILRFDIFLLEDFAHHSTLVLHAHIVNCPHPHLFRARHHNRVLLRGEDHHFDTHPA